MSGSSAQQATPRGPCVKRRPLEQHLKDCDDHCSSADYHSNFQLFRQSKRYGVANFHCSWTNVEYAIQIYFGVQL